MTNKNFIIGAISGDIIGSVFEWHNVKSLDFNLFCPKSRFTDDSVLTLATMFALINDTDYTQAYHSFGRKFPNAR